MIRRSKTVVLITLLLAVLLLPATVFAVAAEYTKSYIGDDSLAFGALVSLKAGSDTTVELTTPSNAKQFLGVYVGEDTATLAINRMSNQQQIAISGKVVALVSDIDGKIHKGDLLVASPIAGVASKNDIFGRGTVVGIASSDFAESGSKNTKVTITQADGKKKQVVVGPLTIDLFAIKNGLEPKPNLIGWVERVSGKPVSTLKITAALVLTITLVGCVTAMAYSAIRNAIVQSSRNPLAKPVIMETLLRVCVIISMVSTVGIVVIYAVLRA